jgi:hypothetical protein
MSAADDNASDNGSSMPDIVGSVAKVADTGVMKDLLGRTFKAVGDYYGEQVEDFLINEESAGGRMCEIMSCKSRK